MILFKKAGSLTNYLGKNHSLHESVGFVPTMGAIHEGHISLITRAKNETGVCISSIFINPTQFNNPEDFNKYPVSLEKDIDMLEDAGCDILFLPAATEIYPPGYKAPYYDIGKLETVLEGKYRPGHFQGVCQVVDRLLEIVRPAKLYLGQKDYQQCMVLKKLVSLKGYETEVVISPTLRETSGLAMSSRNRRLSEMQAESATVIYRQLNYIKQNIRKGDLAPILQTAKEKLETEGFVIDYISIADADTLEEVQQWDGKTRLVALVAATTGQVRLIDNLVLHG